MRDGRGCDHCDSRSRAWVSERVLQAKRRKEADDIGAKSRGEGCVGRKTIRITHIPSPFNQSEEILSCTPPSRSHLCLLGPPPLDPALKLPPPRTEGEHLVHPSPDFGGFPREPRPVRLRVGGHERGRGFGRVREAEGVDQRGSSGRVGDWRGV